MRKLYCATFRDKDGQISDTIHLLGRTNASVHTRLDRFLSQCSGAGIGDDYSTYSFFEVSSVDGFNILIGGREDKR